jgi:hypothetical protein
MPAELRCQSSLFQRRGTSRCIAVLFLSALVGACEPSGDFAPAKPLTNSTHCWKKGTVIYRDRNQDGRIDWQVSGENWRSDGADIYKTDTNYDGFYDLEESFGYGVAGKPTTGWSKNIHERVPAVSKELVPIEKPNWVE